MAIRTRDWYFSLINIVAFSPVTVSNELEFIPETEKTNNETELTEQISLKKSEEKPKNLFFSQSDSEEKPIAKPPAKKPKKPDGGNPSGGSSTPKQTQKVLVAFGLLLDTQICEALKLQELNLKNIKKNYKEISTGSIVKIHTQSDGIRAGFFSQWVALFYKAPEEGGDIDLTSTITVNFVTPGDLTYGTVETHLINLKTITINGGSHIYFNESLKKKRIRGANK